MAELHLATIYYRPRFQGGDVMRPLCQNGLGYTPVDPAHLTSDPAAVTCFVCKRKMRSLTAEHA